MPVKFQYDIKSNKVILVEFANGKPVDGTKFSSEIYEEKRHNAKYKDRKVLLVKGKHVNYIGNNFDYRLSHPYACKYALAKINRKTNCAQIYDTDYFKLKPMYKPHTINETPTLSTDKSNQDRDLKLTKAFGTKLKQRRQLAVNIETLDSTVLKDVEALTSKSDYVLQNDDIESVNTLLPYNKAATSVEEVYVLTEIIPKNVFLSPSSLARRFTGITSTEIEKFSSEKGVIGSKFVLQLLAKQVGLGDQDSAINLALILLFFIHLSNTFSTSKKKRSKNSLFSLSSPAVKDWISSTFQETIDGRTRVAEKQKDKLLATIIVLAWHLTSFSFEVELVRSVLNVPIKRFGQVVASLGGRLRNEFAVLPFPPADIGHGFKLRSKTAKEFV